MKKETKFLICLVCVFLFTPYLNSGTGRSGGYFLRIIQSPRAQAIGESGTALYGNLLQSLNLNPSGICLSNEKFSLSYSMYIEDISISNFGYVIPLKNNDALGIGGSLFMIKPFESYDNEDNYLGKIDSKSFFVSIYYSAPIYNEANDTSGLFAGGGIKYAREVLDNVGGGGLLFDISTLYLKEIGENEKFGIGLSLQSIGNGFTFDFDRVPPPTIYRVGVSYIINLYPNDTVSLAFDIRKPNDNDIKYSGGMEYLFKNFMYARIGFVDGIDLGNGLRFGIGFNLKDISIDYALASYGRFGFSHNIGLSYKFGKKIKIIKEKIPMKKEKIKEKETEKKNEIKQKRGFEGIIF